jgi:hypothetical protein
MIYTMEFGIKGNLCLKLTCVNKGQLEDLDVNIRTYSKSQGV